MAPQICIFEDNHFSQFLPLVHFRPVYALRCGIFSLKEKIVRAYPRANTAIQCRKSLAVCIKFRKPQFSINEISAAECLFINGRVLADETLAKKIPLASKQDVVYVSNKQLIAAACVQRFGTGRGLPTSIRRAWRSADAWNITSIYNLKGFNRAANIYLSLGVERVSHPDV